MISNFKYSTFADVLKGLFEIFTIWTLKKKIWNMETLNLVLKLNFFKRITSFNNCDDD